MEPCQSRPVHQPLQAGDSYNVSLQASSIPLGTLVAVFDPSNTSGIVTTVDRAFWSTLPYILIAVGLIAYLKSTGAEVMIAAAFEGREIEMIVMAALMGGLAPFCSREVIPFIAALLSLGVFGGGVVKLMRDCG